MATETKTARRTRKPKDAPPPAAPEAADGAASAPESPPEVADVPDVTDENPTPPAAPATQPHGFACEVAHADLARILPIVRRAAAGRTTLPVLQHFLLTAQGDRLRVSGTNLEVGVVTEIPALVTREGRFTAPAALLTDHIGRLAGGTVALVADGNTSGVTVTAGKSTVTLQGIDPDEFPLMPGERAKGGATWSIDGAVLRLIHRLVSIAAAEDESRPVLAGIHFQLEGEVLVEAADGFRMSTLALPDLSPTELPGKHTGVIVPAKAWAEVARLIPPKTAADRKVVLTVNREATNLHFDIPAAEGTDHLPIETYTRLLEGQFPDLKRVVPRSAMSVVKVKRADLMDAVKRVAAFAKDAANILSLAVESDLTGGWVTVSANSPGLGKGSEQVACENEGEPITFGISAPYLLDALAACTGDTVHFKLNGALSPILLADESLPHFTHVIMPMHTVK